MVEAKTFGRWRVTGFNPFIMDKLEDSGLYYADASALTTPDSQQRAFQQLAEKPGIMPRDIIEFREALEYALVQRGKRGKESQLTEAEIEMGEQMGVSEEELLRAKKGVK